MPSGTEQAGPSQPHIGEPGVVARVMFTAPDGRTCDDLVAAPSREQIEDDLRARGMILNGYGPIDAAFVADQAAVGQIRVLGFVGLLRDTITCSNCGYELDGLPIKDGAIRCPECNVRTGVRTVVPRRTEPIALEGTRGLTSVDGSILVGLALGGIFPPIWLATGLAAVLVVLFSRGKAGLPSLAAHGAVATTSVLFLLTA